MLQGLTLPWLVRRLGVSPAEMTNREEATAWVVAGQTALQALANPSIADGAPPAIVKELRKHYENQIHHYECIAEGTAKPSKPSATTLSEAVRQLRLKLINAERSAVIDLRDQGTISDAAFRNVERDLDLEELREE